MNKGFAILPLILGIVFILLLGGVSLEIIQTKQKIANALLEVQNLQKEEKFQEALQTLENLENNFLVRYFGMKKDEIEKEIEKTEELMKGRGIVQEEKSKEVIKEKEEEVERSQVKDCQNDLDCFLEASKNCDLAQVQERVFLQIGSYYCDVLLLAEIRGRKNDKCVLFVKAEKLYELKKEGMTKEESEQEIQKWRSFIEGAQEICQFKNEDLVQWLETLKKGSLPSFENAECEYRGIEILEIFPKL